MNSELLSDDATFTASGRARAPRRGPATDRCPLIVAIHGGGFTSQYFDIPGCSLIERAAARGYGVLALDRLGYGRSRAAGKDVQSLAAQNWPLAGLAVSGAALTPNPDLNSYFERFPADTWVETSANNKDRLMFGSPDTVESGIAELIRPAYVPIATRELLEINTVWPQSAKALLTSVEVPVHFRLAEQDALWVVNDEEIEQLSDLVAAVAGSSAAIVRDAGHCIDFHKTGPQFQDDQLNFALDCCRSEAVI